MSPKTATGPVGRACTRGSGYAAAAALLCVLALAGALSGCSTSVTYLGSSAQGLYFDVPGDWHVASPADLSRFQLYGPQQVALAQASGQSYPVYTSLSSAVPIARLARVRLTGPYPWALAQVYTLGPQDQATLSLQTLQDRMFNVDSLAQSGASVSQLSPTAIVVKGGLRGTLVRFSVVSSTASLAFEQVSLTNPATDKLWVLASGCSLSCFHANYSEINRLVTTFTVSDG